MIKRFIFHSISVILALFIAIKYISGVSFNGETVNIFIAGFIIGIINSFIKPFVNIIFLPLRILTFGIFGLLINLFLIWIVIEFVLKKNFLFENIFSIVATIILIWFLNFLTSLIFIFKK